jgi:hypothetical protein
MDCLFKFYVNGHYKEYEADFVPNAIKDVAIDDMPVFLNKLT